MIKKDLSTLGLLSYAIPLAKEFHFVPVLQGVWTGVVLDICAELLGEFSSRDCVLGRLLVVEPWVLGLYRGQAILDCVFENRGKELTLVGLPGLVLKCQHYNRFRK